MDKLKEIKEKYVSKEITSDEAVRQMFELFDEVGCFDGDVIKEVYEIGRSHERNGSDCTSEMIRNAWVWSDKIYRNLKWD